MEEKICEECGGTGEVTTMEEVYAGEQGHKAPIGTQKCPFHEKEPDRDEE